MPNQVKAQRIEVLTEQVGRAKSIVFAKFSGMNAESQVKLRRIIKEAGGEITISKNRLVKIALGKPTELDEMLQEQLFTLFSYEDEVKAVKALTKFISENEKPEIRGGFMENKVLTVADVEKLSKLPGREELIAMLLNRLQTPGQNLRGVLEAVPGKLVRVLHAVANKQ